MLVKIQGLPKRDLDRCNSVVAKFGVSMQHTEIAFKKPLRPLAAQGFPVSFPAIGLGKFGTPELQALRPTTPTGRTLHLPRKRHIFYEGDAASEWYFVECGSLLCYRVTPSGRRMIPAIYQAGDIIGLETNAEFSTSCITLTDVTAQACKRATLLSLMRCDKVLFEFIWSKILAERADHEQYTRLLGSAALARVCGFILRMARQSAFGDIADVPISRREMADHLCLTVETVCRIFTQLKSDQIIDYEQPRSIQILDQPYLYDHLDM